MAASADIKLSASVFQRPVDLRQRDAKQRLRLESDQNVQKKQLYLGVPTLVKTSFIFVHFSPTSWIGHLSEKRNK